MSIEKAKVVPWPTSCCTSYTKKIDKSGIELRSVSALLLVLLLLHYVQVKLKRLTNLELGFC